MSGGVPAGEAMARRFHETYERLAPTFGYETRPDTKDFDPTSPNGRLMIAVCSELATPTPPIEGRDADVERVVREAVNGLDWDKVYAATRQRALKDVTGTFYDEHLAREIAYHIARAALQVLGERG